MNTNSIKKTISALRVNFKDFKKIFRKYEYIILADKKKLNKIDCLADSYNFKELDIIPITKGQGGRAVKGAIGGLELLAGSFLTFATAGIGAEIGVDLMVAGAATIGGVIINSFMKPKDYNMPDNGSAGNNVFDGGANVSKEGVAIPIVYGVMKVGSVVASGLIQTNN